MAEPILGDIDLNLHSSPERRRELIDELRGAMGTLPAMAPKKQTRFFRGVEGIEVFLIDAPRNPYKAIFSITAATWGNVWRTRKWDTISPEARFYVVQACLQGKSLPNGMEAPSFTFEVAGVSRAAFDQIARIRLGAVIGSMGVRDNNHADADYRVPEAVWKNPERLAKHQKQLLAAKDAYVDDLEYGNGNWQDARALMPMSALHRFSIAMNYTALRGFMGKRLMACFPGETPILTGSGKLVEIRDIKPGDEVWTHSGNLSSVVRVFPNRPYTGDIVTVRAFGNYRMPIRGTSDHKVMGAFKDDFDVSKSERWHQTYVPEKIEKSLSWIELGKLGKGDIIAYRIPEFSEELYDVSIDEFYLPYFRPGMIQPRRLKSIKLDSELGWFVGMYIAEGYGSRTNFTFTLGKSWKEKQFGKRIIKFVNEYGFRASMILTEHGYRVRVFNPQLAGWLRSICGAGAFNKQLPEWIHKTPKSFRTGLLEGWIDGDGTKNPSTGAAKGSISGVSISLALILGLRDLALSLDWLATIRKRETEGINTILGRSVICHDKYELHLRPWVKEQSKGARFWRTEKWMLFLVRDSTAISVVDFPVFNFEVEGEHSYNLSQLTVANCEQADTVAAAWLIRLRIEEAFPLLAAYLRPSCDLVKRCTYHEDSTLSEAFGCLFRGCGRWPEALDEYATFNESCSDYETMSRQAGFVAFSGDKKLVPERFDDLAMSDKVLFRESLSA